MSYECILKCVPFYIIYALKFVLPFPSSPAVGNNLVVHSFPSSDSVPCLPRTSVTDQPVVDSARGELRWPFEVFRWRESFQYRVTRPSGDVLKQPQLQPAVSNSRALEFYPCLPRKGSGPIDSLSELAPVPSVPQASAGAWARGGGVGSGRSQEGTQGQRKKNAVKSYGFKIARVYTMVTLGPFLTLSKSRDEIRL